MANTNQAQTVTRFRIGGKSENSITRRYAVGVTREGFHRAVKSTDSRSLARILHVADVTMPSLFCGSAQDMRVWRRDEILAHFGLQA